MTYYLFSSGHFITFLTDTYDLIVLTYSAPQKRN